MNSLCPTDRCLQCPDRVVCRCLQVTESDLIEVLTTRDIGTVKELRRHTGAGDGCTACHHQLRQYIERYG